MNFWPDFIKLKTAIGGNREKYFYEEGVGVKKEDYGSSDEYENPEDDNREFLASQTRQRIDITTYLITNN